MPSILVQPVDQVVAPGQTTTFSVQADGGGQSVTYEWYWNGVLITDMTGATFTTRSAEVADNGSTFTVVATNAVGSVTSRAATLTVSPAPRVPPRGDLRFQGVGAAPFRIPIISAAVRCGSVYGYAAAGGTPLALDANASGSTACGAWFFTATALPPTVPLLGITYAGRTGVGGLLANLDDLGRTGGVITSLDVEDLADQYAYSEVRSTEGSFQQVYHSVDLADVGALAASEAASGRVVTALASHAGAMLVVSYGWSGDAGTVYETSVRGASVTSLGDVATGLSGEGFVITAMGRDGAGGLVLVGTRVRGDRTPRPLAIASDWHAPSDLLSRGYAIVGYAFVLDTGVSTWVWVAQQ